MREKMLSIGDDAWIDNQAGQHIFRVNGKALRLRRTLIIEDANGTALVKIQDRPVRVRDVMEIESADGQSLAHVKKALISPLRQRFVAELSGGGEIKAQGNILDHEFELERDGKKIAEVSKRWFRVRETYGIEVAPGGNDALVLAITVCIDEMARAV